MTRYQAGRRGQDASLWKGAVSGAVAGAVSGVVMETVQASIMPQIQHGIEHARESVRAVSERHERERAASARSEPALAHTRGHVTYASGGHEQTVQVDLPDTAEATEQVLESEEDGMTSTAGHELAGSEEPVGRGAHYARAVTSGTLYGIAAEYDARVTFGHGTAFGAAEWLAGDEVLVPALGLSKEPTEQALEMHASALASHLVYGVTAEFVRRNVRKALD